jgi:hypothetical protein
MQRAREAMIPFKLEWKSVEWFGTYVVGQRVARHFMDPDAKIFIAGDVRILFLCRRFATDIDIFQAGHCHSALAAQGANTSMHDSFNLAWKLNLVTRGLAQSYLLHTYEEERQKIAYDLINFDIEHCKAFSEGEASLAKNFDDNIRFIAGFGAEYSPGTLTRRTSSLSSLQPGMLQLPAKVTRYIDANPVDVQLDIPLLGQFKIYIFVPDIRSSEDALEKICQQFDNALAHITSLADQSYEKIPRGASPSDEYQQIQRYIAVSNAFTFAMVTKSSQLDFEISELPEMLQKSRWTLYIDNCQTPDCTAKWFGDLGNEKVGVAIVRPDGYIGAIDRWHSAQVETIGRWVEEYFSFII